MLGIGDLEEGLVWSGARSFFVVFGVVDKRRVQLWGVAGEDDIAICFSCLSA